MKLQARDGRYSAYPYAYMTCAEFDPDKGIEIFVSSAVIEMKGRERFLWKGLRLRSGVDRNPKTFYL